MKKMALVQSILIYLSMTIVILAGTLLFLRAISQQQFQTTRKTDLSPSAASQLPILPNTKLTRGPTGKDTVIPILMYHYIRSYLNPRDRIGINLSVDPVTFNNQLIRLKLAGYQTITFNDLDLPLPPKPIILTFDDGYADAYTMALPILRQHQMKGVFYLITDFIGRTGYLTTDQIKVLAKDMEIGDHTLSHADLAKVSNSEVERQIVASKRYLEELLGKKITAFCYPSGKYNLNTITILGENGFTSATTTRPGLAKEGEFKSNPFELRRVRVTNNPDILDIIAKHQKPLPQIIPRKAD